VADSVLATAALATLPTGGPLARLEAVIADESIPGVVFQRVCDGETLRDIAKAWELPKGQFVRWFSTEHADLYDAALKVRADDLAHEALSISDEQSEVVKENGDTFDPDVPRDKLRIDTRLKLASRWDRKRYGEENESRNVAPVTIQIANLRGAPVTVTAGPAAIAVVDTTEAIETTEGPI
jgi:hypothetical protein